MLDVEYEQKLMELDRLLNDPDSPMEPSRVWALMAEISDYERDADIGSRSG